jgi:hypothetical protein
MTVRIALMRCGGKRQRKGAKAHAKQFTSWASFNTSPVPDQSPNIEIPSWGPESERVKNNE